MQLTTTVPQDARIGKSRLRLRLTDNGLTDAEDDVNGQTIDFPKRLSLGRKQNGYRTNDR